MMDPQANLNEQLDLARSIAALDARWDETMEPMSEDEQTEYLEQAGRLAALVVALDEWRRNGGFDPYSTKPRVVTLVIRDPDYENEYVDERTDGVEVETIDIDLGSQFNGPKDFDADSDWGREWLADTRQSVAHLPEDGPIRQRVEELIGHLTKKEVAQ